MAKYLLWRSGLLIPSVLATSMIVFAIMTVLPGDVAIVILSGSGESPHSVEVRQALEDELGLNEPSVVQYGQWLWSMLNGEFGGRSLMTREPIGSLLSRALPATLLLAVYTILISILVSIPMGMIAALNKNRLPDYCIRLFTLVGLAMPNFWIASLLLLGLLMFFQWSPPLYYVNLWEDPWTHLQLLCWPVLILSWEHSSQLVRVNRSRLLDVFGQSYILTAQAKGLARKGILLRHALPNALPPTVTLLGLQLNTLIGGVLILEVVFGIPGIGRSLVQAAIARDFPVVQSIVTLIVSFSLLANLLIDLAYAYLDPRITYEAT